MVVVAQGVNKITAFGKQTALGTPKSGAGGFVARRVTFVPQFERNTYENNEIVADQQSRGISYGMKKTSAKLSALLSPGTFSLLMAAALRKDWVAGVNGTSVSHTIALVAGPPKYWTITRVTGWLTEGFKIGDVITTATAGFNAANKNKNLLIIGLTATVANVVPLNGVDLVAEGPIATSVFSVVGKKTLAPLTGHTNDYFTLEDWYSDISKSETFPDSKVDKIDIKIPATGNVTADFDFLGLSRTKGGAQVLTTPTTSGTGICTSINGVVLVNGVVQAICTGAQVTIDPGMNLADAVLASNAAVDIVKGVIKVSGSFTAMFDAHTISDLFSGETPIGLVFVAAVDQSGNSAFVSFNMSRVKLTGDAPDDGQKLIIRTYPFTAEIDVNGGTSAANDQTILTIQDSAA